MLNAFHILIFLLNISVAKTPIAKIIPKIDDAQTLYAECQLTGVVSYNASKDSSISSRLVVAKKPSLPVLIPKMGISFFPI